MAFGNPLGAPWRILTMSPSRSVRPVASRPTTAVVLRSLLATVETVGFAAWVHSRSGGHLPPLEQTLALSVVVFLGALAVLGGQQARLWMVAPLMIGAQVALHEGFSRMSDLGGGAAPMDHMGSMHAVEAPPEGSMLLAHLVIGVVAVLVLACQDQALMALAGMVHVLLGGSAPQLPRLGTRPTAPRSERLTSALISSAPRRGPPRRLLLTP